MQTNDYRTWNGYQKLYNGITWFSDSVQAGIFVAEHERWIKKECQFVKKITYYMLGYLYQSMKVE